MKNKYILLEMNQRNEIRADVNMTIKNMELTEIESVEIDYFSAWGFIYKLLKKVK